ISNGSSSTSVIYTPSTTSSSSSVSSVSSGARSSEDVMALAVHLSNQITINTDDVVEVLISRPRSQTLADTTSSAMSTTTSPLLADTARGWSTSSSSGWLDWPAAPNSRTSVSSTSTPSPGKMRKREAAFASSYPSSNMAHQTNQLGSFPPEAVESAHSILSVLRNAATHSEVGAVGHQPLNIVIRSMAEHGVYSDDYFPDNIEYTGRPYVPLEPQGSIVSYVVSM
ncbi:hypothetical protein EV175_007241, partial [Coemansia sp. RSA 1933]